MSLLELLVAAGVASVILSSSLGILVEQRRQLLGDRTRSNVNDNLRIASDLIGQDIKQTGERLEANNQLPGISIIPGNIATDPDRLVLQRQLLTETLPVCQDLSNGNTIDVSVTGNPTVTSCPYSNGVTTPNPPENPVLTDNLRAWRNYRWSLDGTPTAGGGGTCQQLSGGSNLECSWAYIHDPVNLRGEFFLYSGETSGSCLHSSLSGRTCLKIQRANGTTWQNTYTYANRPVIYLLEEREYRLALDSSTNRTDDYILERSLNRQPAQRIASQLSNFQVQAQRPSTLTPSNPSTWGCDASNWCSSYNPDLTQIRDWQDIAAVRITLTAINPNDQLLKVDPTRNFLSLTSQFLPRNVLSR